MFGSTQKLSGLSYNLSCTDRIPLEWDQITVSFILLYSIRCKNLSPSILKNIPQIPEISYYIPLWVQSHPQLRLLDLREDLSIFSCRRLPYRFQMQDRSESIIPRKQLCIGTFSRKLWLSVELVYNYWCILTGYLGWGLSFLLSNNISPTRHNLNFWACRSEIQATPKDINHLRPCNHP